MKKSQVKFNASALKEAMFKNLVEVQTQKLIEYANEKVRLIGDAIQLYSSRNHFDRTGNLLNSICWGVVYNRELKASGFYRDAKSQSAMAKSGEHYRTSFLHEFYWKWSIAFPVDGRALAEQYIKSHGKDGAMGYWRVWFAILAPYWGYWEEGFKMKSSLGHKEQFLRFQVMTEFYDKVSNELSPANVKIKVYVPEYTKAYTINFKNGRTSYRKSSVEREYDKYDNQRGRRK